MGVGRRQNLEKAWVAFLFGELCRVVSHQRAFALHENRALQLLSRLFTFSIVWLRALVQSEDSPAVASTCLQVADSDFRLRPKKTSLPPGSSNWCHICVRRKTPTSPSAGHRMLYYKTSIHPNSFNDVP